MGQAIQAERQAEKTDRSSSRGRRELEANRHRSQCFYGGRVASATMIRHAPIMRLVGGSPGAPRACLPDANGANVHPRSGVVNGIPVKMGPGCHASYCYE